MDFDDRRYWGFTREVVERIEFGFASVQYTRSRTCALCSCECSNVPSGCIKGKGFLDSLVRYQCSITSTLNLHEVLIEFYFRKNCLSYKNLRLNGIYSFSLKRFSLYWMFNLKYEVPRFNDRLWCGTCIAIISAVICLYVYMQWMDNRAFEVWEIPTNSFLIRVKSIYSTNQGTWYTE
jgi:hypothetical protein